MDLSECTLEQKYSRMRRLCLVLFVLGRLFLFFFLNKNSNIYLATVAADFYSELL